MQRKESYNENSENIQAVKRYNNCHFADDYNFVGSDYIGLGLGVGLAYFGLGLGLFRLMVLLTSLLC